MSNFAGLSTGYTALVAHRRRIDVISENIANIDTPGYHRQTVQLESLAAPKSIGFWAGKRDTGGGVDVRSISRAGSSLLEDNARRAISVADQMSTEEDVMLQIEDAVSGLSDQGIRAEFDALWNAFDDLASLPEDLGVRRVTLERAEAVGRSLRSAAKSLNTLHLTQMATAEVQVSRINELANSIAALDRQIIGGAASGAAPNGLIDQRDLMVGEMASLIDVSAVPESDGQISITIDGFLVVGDGRSRPVRYESQPAPLGDATGLSVSSLVGGDGRVLTPSGGSLGGLIGAANTLIRHERQALDDLAVFTANTVNAIHSSGVALDGTTGHDLFEVTTGAIDIRISADLEGHPERLAAAEVGAGVLDETNARALADLSEDPDGPSARVGHLIDTLSVRVSAAVARSAAAEKSADQATGLAEASGGVSLDQELTDLITAQRSYEAAARLITAADQMLQTLMTTGLVGR